MTKRPISGLLLLLVAGALAGCGAEPEPAEPAAETNTMPNDDTGSILRLHRPLDAIVPLTARIEKLADGLAFTEGPVWVRGGGYLLFSDIPANAIYKWTPDGELTEFLRPVFDGEGDSVGSNGLTVDAEGRLILMEHGNRHVSRLEADGTRTVLADRHEGQRFNSPNDGAYHSNGWLYFTDPPYGLPGGDDDPAKELDFSGIYRLGPAGEVELLNREQTRPNGLAFSPSETTLYVANSDAERRLWIAYGVLEDGTLDDGRVFFDVTGDPAPGNPDGLKVDRAGNVFATGPGGVWVFDPAGTHLGTIQPDEIPANVAWGDDGRTLYITARTGLYRVALVTQGIMP
ncbi:MAG: SMP-30/gluconolactonase/LRE family protein [Dehalococcoidia bacterium]|nr:SMP-30/gluconolactonase/LRE family protein [Dehalococcoidia bacterium]